MRFGVSDDGGGYSLIQWNPTGWPVVSFWLTMQLYIDLDEKCCTMISFYCEDTWRWLSRPSPDPISGYFARRLECPACVLRHSSALVGGEKEDRRKEDVAEEEELQNRYTRQPARSSATAVRVKFLVINLTRG
jgi:hypothetical protein